MEDAEVFLHEADHGKRRGVRALGDGDVDGAATVDQGVAGHRVGAVDDLGDVADQDRGVLAGTDRDVLEVLDVLDCGVDGDQQVLVAKGEVSGRGDDIRSSESGGDFLGRDAGATKAIRDEVDEDAARAAAEGRRSRDARQGGEERTHGVERGVLQLGNGAGLAREDELTDRHATGVETHDERRYGAGRHHGASTVHVADGLAHGLRHVRPGVELELHDRRALDVLGFDVFDAGDVKEVVFVIIRQEAFHLAGFHPAKRLGDVDRRDVQGWEHVLGHAVQAEEGGERQGHDRDDQGDRSTQDQGEEIHRGT